MMKNIAILGAGFGGISVAKNLIGRVQNNFQIILIDKNPYHTFNVSLYEVATATLGKRHPRKIDFQNLSTTAMLQIKDIFLRNQNLQFIQATVQDIDLQKKKVFLEKGKTIPFDYLVFALGSETNFFEIPGIKEKALPLKGIYEALNIRNAIQEVFERKQPNQRITILIGGGGFTGCEFASELVSYVQKLSRDFKHPREKIKIFVIEASNNSLPGASDWVRKTARKRMEKLGIEFLFGKPISGVQNSTILFKTGGKLYFDILVWTAGVKANSLLEKINGVKLEKGCRVLSDDCLRIVPYPRVFGVGDNLYCFDPAIEAPMPATARAAILQGKIVARNILLDIKGEKVTKCPSLTSQLVIPLGGKWAIVDAGTIKFAGFFGWLVKELIALRYFLTLLPFFQALTLWLRGVKMYIRND